jgi:hypothetical protein
VLSGEPDRYQRSGGGHSPRGDQVRLATNRNGLNVTLPLQERVTLLPALIDRFPFNLRING